MADTTTTSQSPPPKPSAQRPEVKTPVNRNRRATFAFITVGFSLAMMTYIAIAGMTNAAAMSALDGFKDVAIWIGVGYIGGSAVDFGSSMLSQRGRGRYGGYGGYGGGYSGGYGRYGDDQADGRVSD